MYCRAAASTVHIIMSQLSRLPTLMLTSTASSPTRNLLQQLQPRCVASYYLRQGGYVFTYVCMSLCLLTGLFRNC